MSDEKRKRAVYFFSLGHLVLLLSTLLLLWWLYGDRYSRDLNRKNAPDRVELKGFQVVNFHFDDQAEGLSAASLPEGEDKFTTLPPFTSQSLQQAKKMWIRDWKERKESDE